MPSLRRPTCSYRTLSLLMAPFIAMMFAGQYGPATLCPAAENPLSKPILVLDAGGHSATVRKVVFAPDGTKLITVSDDKTIREWDLASGQPSRVLRPPIGRGTHGMLFAVALSPDGRILAVGGCGFRDVPVYLIAMATGNIERTLDGHTDSVNVVVFSPDGRSLASASFDKTIRLWDLGTGKCRMVLQGHSESVMGLAYSPDGTRLVSGSHDHTARIWSVETGQVLATLQGHQDAVRNVAWSADGATIATGGYDDLVILWDANGRLRQRLPKLGDQVQAVAISPDSRTLLAGLGSERAVSRAVYLFDLRTGAVQLRFDRHTNTVQEGVFSPDGKLIATSGGNDSEVYLWRPDGTVVQRLAGSGRRVWSCGWSPDGTRIAWGNTFARNRFNDYGPLERAFDLTTLEFVDVQSSPFRGAITSQDSLQLQAADHFKLLLKRGNQIAAQFELRRLYEGNLRSFSFLSGDTVAVGANFGLPLLDIPTGKPVRYLWGHTGGVLSLAPSYDGRFLLSSSADQTVRIWDPRRQEPLLSLFFAGNEWIAWTPEGYYAASPGGERLMGWHVNQGRAQMAAYHPAAQFRKSLYRPDVIKVLLHCGSTEQALELADRERGRSTQFTRAAEVLPPDVAITAPAGSPLQVDQPGLELRVTASPKGQDPITALRVLIDGRPYGEVKRAAQTAEPVAVDATWNLTLEPGTHQIAVKAETAKSYNLSPPVEVTYAWKESGGELPTLYVLAVGISAYPDEKLRLNYGAADAQGVADIFQKKAAGVYRKVEQQVIVDAQATQRSILRGMEWLRKQMTQRDVGVLFFAGHGAKDDQGLFHLLPVDCTPEELGIAGIGEDQIKRLCQSIPGRLVLLLDACHTGALGGDKRRAIAGLTDNLVRDLITDDYGVVVMCSSMGREESRERDEWGHGAFTKALIEGLEGQADFNRDRSIYLNELDLYVTDRVKQLTDGRQHPVTQKPTTIRSFPLARP